jgi:hypothetical protein
MITLGDLPRNAREVCLTNPEVSRLKKTDAEAVSFASVAELKSDAAFWI